MNFQLEATDDSDQGNSSCALGSLRPAKSQFLAILELQRQLLILALLRSLDQESGMFHIPTFHQLSPTQSLEGMRTLVQMRATEMARDRWARCMDLQFAPQAQPELGLRHHSRHKSHTTHLRRGLQEEQPRSWDRPQQKILAQ